MDPLLILDLNNSVEPEGDTNKSLVLLDGMISKAKSDDWISNKIRHLVTVEGKPQEQAVAIAHNMAGKSKDDAKKSLEPRLYLAL